MFRTMAAAAVTVVVALIAAWPSAASAHTQEATATFSGVVLDEVGGAIADVRVTVVNLENGLQRATVTNAEGAFTVPLLPPGRYAVTAQREAFTPTELPEVVLTSREPVAVRIQLKVAAMSEGIVVTAQKRGEERLQDVPVPVAVLDARRLATTNAVLLREYYARVPSFSVTPTYAGSQMLAIRGVTMGGFSNPTVALTIDDVPFGASSATLDGNQVPDIDTSDLQRVEVLRGPQGTLYGANSMGGVVKYSTIDPSTDRVSGTMTVGSDAVKNGSGAGYNVSGAVNVPAGPRLGIRASGFARLTPGYIDNPVLGLDGVNEGRGYGGRVSTLWHLSNAVSVKANALYQHLEADGSSDINRLPGLGDLEQNYVPGLGGYDRTIQSYSAVLRAKLAGLELTSVTAYNRNTYTNTLDFSSAYGKAVQAEFGVGGAGFFAINTGNTKFSQEARLSGSIGSRLEWLGGVFYTNEDSPNRATIPAMDPATGHEVGLYWDHTYPAHFNEAAVFGSVTWKVTPRFDIQVGGRRNETKQWNSDDVQSRPVGGPPTGPVIVPGLTSRGGTFTYLVTPRFRPSANVMIYGRLASGYRPGGPNAGTAGTVGAPTQYDADTTRNYEVGLKTEVLERRLSLDASLYYIDWSNFQLQLRTPEQFVYTTNGAAAKSQGLELSVSSTPLRRTTLAGWVSYGNAVLTEGFPANAPAVGRSGDRLPNSSRVSGNLSFEQELPLTKALTGFIGGTASYVGDRRSIFGATADRVRFPAYTKVDLRAGVRHRSWSTTFYINNAGDSRGVLQGGVGYLPPFGFIIIQPRTIGLSVSRSF